MKIKKPKKLTDKQWEVVQLWNPWGANLNIVEIANRLGVSKQTVSKKLQAFKEKYPEGYENILMEKKERTETERQSVAEEIKSAESFDENRHVVSDDPVHDNYSARIRKKY